MFKFFAGLVFITASLLSLPTWACRGNTQVPPHGKAAGYEVFAVEVTGVHVTSYEQYQAATLKLQTSPRASNVLERLYPTSSTPSFRVHVLVHSSTSAAGGLFRSFPLGGCGVRVPGLKEHGLLFVAPSGSVGVVWADRVAEYQYWLKQLNLSPGMSPNNSSKPKPLRGSA